MVERVGQGIALGEWMFTFERSVQDKEKMEEKVVNVLIFFKHTRSWLRVWFWFVVVCNDTVYILYICKKKKKKKSKAVLLEKRFEAKKSKSLSLFLFFVDWLEENVIILCIPHR